MIWLHALLMHTLYKQFIRQSFRIIEFLVQVHSMLLKLASHVLFTVTMSSVCTTRQQSNKITLSTYISNTYRTINSHHTSIQAASILYYKVKQWFLNCLKFIPNQNLVKNLNFVNVKPSKIRLHPCQKKNFQRLSVYTKN